MSDDVKRQGRYGKASVFCSMCEAETLGASVCSECAGCKKKITFELAPAVAVKEDRERTQTVDIITDMTQRCSRCKTEVIGEPLGLVMQDVVDSQGMNAARYAVASAMYCEWHDACEPGEPLIPFDELLYEKQAPWMKATGADGWHLYTFLFESIGIGLDDKVRQAGIEEAKKWPAFTDRRKVFRVNHAQFPAGWVHIGFNQHSGKTGEPYEYMGISKHICPKCASLIFDVACIDPKDPFGHGSIS